MQNLLLSAQVMLPPLLFMVAGYIARCALKLRDDWIRVTNRVLFRIFLPVLLFKQLYNSDLSSVFQASTLWLIGFSLLGICITVGVLCLTVPRFEAEFSRRGSLIQGMYRSNTAIFGIPIALSLYGEGNITIVTLLVAALVPVFNILAVIILEVHRGGKPSLRKILRSIATNPLIIGLAVGMLVCLTGLALPAPILYAVDGFAGVATPMSFFVLGAAFSFKAASHNIRPLMAAVSAKLVLIPLVWVTLAALIGFRDQALIAVLVIFAPPTAVSSYPMAVAMDADGQLSSEIVVFTSAFSILTMFLWIFALKSLMLI